MPRPVRDEDRTMTTRPMLSVLSIALAAFSLATSRADGPAARGVPLNLWAHERSNAQAGHGAKPEMVRVTFEPAEWPNIRFPAPGGKPWDWSGRSFALELRNLDAEELEVHVRVDDDPSADGIRHCRTGHATLPPRQTTTLTLPLSKVDPMAHGMRALPGASSARELTVFGDETFNPSHITMFQVFLHGPARARSLEIRSASIVPAASSSLEGIVDGFGQYARADWPGKVHSVADLKARHEAEAADLRAHPAPSDRDRFGGWKDGPRERAGGFFRTTYRDGRWWLVDPEGAPFVSLGVDVVTMGEQTIVEKRESMFASLPGRADPLARHFGMAFGIHSGPVKQGRTFSFYAANLERVYGRDAFRPWRERTLERLPSWGFNTIGNWSDPRFYKNGKVPYTATANIDGNHARVSSGSDYWGKMHDPFDPQFALDVKASLARVVPKVKGDEWCIGYFVDNELSWGGFGDQAGRVGLAIGALGASADGSPAKRAIVGLLRAKYTEIARLNAAWKAEIADWKALEAPWHPAGSQSKWTDAMRDDLRAFVTEFARTYFRTIRDELKAQDPDHLYLGCRFAWRTEEAIAAAAEICDVVSFNIYERKVDPAKWGFLNGLKKPAIIGEFHVGALDRGMFHTGLVSASSQDERAAIYREYVGSVLDHPALVGCHWFQYVDEPITGRSYDGENYNIGFLSVTDTPYPELVAAAREVHAKAYSRRAAGKATP
ncbi:beta-agarase [Aquisphaera insulae]|uniref:beta-agarase n=1 Tax=Aquisphaera insulae TaxID=2712864 RepID=UPI0013ED188F|nr:beta-agarase [Aquisphaera insulae]